jgi:hypothetical protein
MNVTDGLLSKLTLGGGIAPQAISHNVPWVQV